MIDTDPMTQPSGVVRKSFLFTLRPARLQCRCYPNEKEIYCVGRFSGRILIVGALRYNSELLGKTRTLMSVLDISSKRYPQRSQNVFPIDLCNSPTDDLIKSLCFMNYSAQLLI